MAEDTRKRPDYASDFTSKSAPAGDPLAELARLIGQSDPFAEHGKRGPAGGASKPIAVSRNDDRPAPEWLARPAPAPEPDDNDYPAVVRAGPREDYASPYDHPASDDMHAAYVPAQAAAADHAHEPHAVAAPETSSADHHAADQPAEAYAVDDRYRVAPPAPEYDHDSYYADDGHMPPRGDDGIVSSSRKRGGLITIAAVLGLAVIGTAGAFGYRAFTSGSGASANPPVIKADPTPAKTVPPAATAAVDAQGKPFQERAPGAAERVVPREEQPVAVPVAPRPPGAQAAPAPLTPPPPAATEPKRVKTVTIRQDTGANDTGTVAAPPAVQSTARAPAATKQSGSAPLAIAPQSDAAARTKVAARPAANPPPAAGSYAVQVSAQRSEAEAQSAYQNLQTRYPAVLGGRQASIRRVDLGDKGGVFYRAQVGAFPTPEQATTFCDSLKSAGGQCIVQRN